MIYKEWQFLTRTEFLSWPASSSMFRSKSAHLSSRWYKHSPSKGTAQIICVSQCFFLWQNMWWCPGLKDLQLQRIKNLADKSLRQATSKNMWINFLQVMVSGNGIKGEMQKTWNKNKFSDSQETVLRKTWWSKIQVGAPYLHWQVWCRGNSHTFLPIH